MLTAGGNSLDVMEIIVETDTAFTSPLLPIGDSVIKTPWVSVCQVSSHVLIVKNKLVKDVSKWPFIIQQQQKSWKIDNTSSKFYPSAYFRICSRSRASELACKSTEKFHHLKNNQGAEEMAQLVQSLLHSHEDLSSDCKH